MEENIEFFFDEVFKEYMIQGEIQEIGKILGKGSFGIVREVKFKNKIVAGKLIVKESLSETEYSDDLKGPNIIRFFKVCKPIYKYGKIYHLIIMEKAILKDLGKLNNYFHKENLLKLIYKNCFDEEFSDSGLRFYARHIIGGLGTLDKMNIIHFDMKPENILITSNLILKLSDFSISKKIDEKLKEDFLIPGGTNGFLAPEYYLKEPVSVDKAKKQDYFALGCTLFLLKYGFPILKPKKDEVAEIILDKMVESILRKINFIKSRKFVDKDFITFITHLINIQSDYRYNFQQIYRNKWVNKNLEPLEKVADNFDADEEKFLMELQKMDFLLQKKEIFECNKINDNINNKEKSKNKSFKRNIRQKFKFKKKKEEDESDLYFFN